MLLVTKQNQSGAIKVQRIPVFYLVLGVREGGESLFLFSDCDKIGNLVRVL